MEKGGEALANETKMKAKKCVDVGVQTGVRSAVIAAAIVTPVTLAGCYYFPWARRNLNHTAQALIISSATIASYFITCEEAIMKCTRETSIAAIEEKRARLVEVEREQQKKQ